MTRKHYLELCRIAIADLLGLGIDEVRTRTLRNPWREGVRTYRHAVDLWWKLENSLAMYLNIAAVLWRERREVAEREVLVIAKVKEKVGAHQAMLITNGEFSKRAVTVADNEGVALLRVWPLLDTSRWCASRRDQIQEEIRASAKGRRKVYGHRVVHPGLARGMRVGRVVPFRKRRVKNLGKEYNPFEPDLPSNRPKQHYFNLESFLRRYKSRQALLRSRKKRGEGRR